MSEHVEGDGSMQAVVECRLRPHTAFMMNPVVKTHFWALKLACGHEVERFIRWLPQGPDYRRRGYAAMHHAPSLSRLPPEPKRTRCGPERRGVYR